ncbi:MAG: hypothetical protein KDC05_11665, partial [Bacteroidales bacterium]|nr:hypothetical protein [Bacteroidales bacterium]
MKSGWMLMLIGIAMTWGAYAQVTTYPYTESFESGTGSWYQDTGDNFDWTRISGATPTWNTGPATAANGSYYMYIECDGNLASKRAQLLCNFDFSSVADPFLTFSYHMFGDYCNNLRVDVNNGSGWTNSVWTFSGQQHSATDDDWTMAGIDLSAWGGLGNVTLRFGGLTPDATWKNRGDIAIDFVTVQPKSLKTIASFPYCESFESGWGDWYNVTGDDFDWNRNSGTTPTNQTGPDAAHDGNYYLFTECNDHLPDKEAEVLCNVDFTALAEPVISFSYHMYGNTTGTLALDVFDGSAWNNNLWSVSEQQHHAGNSDWTPAMVDLSAFGSMSGVQIRLRGKTGSATWMDKGDMAIDQVCINDKQTTIISSFPYCESFESGYAGWYNEGGDDFDWTRNSGGTPTSGTGPDAAHDGNYYLYTECDYNLPTESAGLVGHFDFTSITSPVLTFAYLMYGSETGSLSVDVFDGSVWQNNLWQSVGQQHVSGNDVWSQPTVDLSAFGGMDDIQIRFRGTTGQYFYYEQGDMAIDQICVDQKEEIIVNAFPYCESFEDDWGSWVNAGDDDFDWTRNSGSTPTGGTGPNKADDGIYYVFVECDYHVPSKTTALECNFDFTGISDPTLSFAYLMFGNETGTLQLDVFDGTSWSNAIWSVSGEQHNSGDAEWTQPTFELPMLAGKSNAKIRLKATTENQNWSYKGDIAIDHICVKQKEEAVVGAFPYCESFENGSGDWFNDGFDDFDWTVNSGSTPTNNTGPDNAGEGTYYLYTECDMHTPSKSANLVCDFDFTTLAQPVLNLSYHMFGSGIGSLTVGVFDGSTWHNSFWQVTGQQQASSSEAWIRPTIDLSAFAGLPNVRLRITGKTGSSTWDTQGDIAIDHICILDKTEFIIKDFPYCESFEDENGTWFNTDGDAFEWTRHSGTTPTSNTGPAAAYNGNYYFFAECDNNLPSKKALLEATFDFTTLPDPALTFYYHMYGSEMGGLKVKVNGTTMFSVEEQKQNSATEPWIPVTLDLSAYGSTNDITVQFEATTGNQNYKTHG